MKLIDVLNMIAKGELEEGTKVSFQGKIYTFGKSDYSDEHMDLFWTDSDGVEEALFENYYLSTVLEREVEIIGHDTNVATKIEEIDTEFLRYTFECEGTFRPVKAITSLGDKLNEVIRELNRRGE